jgi:hypothetical protein
MACIQSASRGKSSRGKRCRGTDPPRTRPDNFSNAETPLLCYPGHRKLVTDDLQLFKIRLEICIRRFDRGTAGERI